MYQNVFTVLYVVSSKNGSVVFQKGKPVSLELGSVCKQYNPVSLSPSSPLVGN